jgi:hypothetical protein
MGTNCKRRLSPTLSDVEESQVSHARIHPVVYKQGSMRHMIINRNEFMEDCGDRSPFGN